MRRSTKKLIRGSFWLFLSQLLINIFSLAFWLLVSHFSSQEVIGYVGNVLASVMWISGLFTLGCEYVVLKYGNSEKGPEYVSSFLFLQLILGGIGWALMFLWAGKGTFSLHYFPYFVLGGAALFLTCLWNFEMFSLISVLRNERVTQVTLTTNSVRLGIAIGIVLAYSKISGIQMLSAGILGMIVGDSLGIYFCLKYLKFSRRFLSSLPELLKLGISNLPSKAFFVLISGLALTVLSLLTHDPVLVGRAYISLMIMTAIAGLPASFAWTSLPISATEEDTYLASIRYSVGLTAIISSLVISSPERILQIINSKMGPAWPLLFLLMISAPLYALLSNLVSKMNYEGKMKELGIMGAILLASFFSSLPLFLHFFYLEALPSAIIFSTLLCLLYASKFEERPLLIPLGKAELSLALGGILGTYVSLHFHSLIGIVPGFVLSAFLLSKLDVLTFGDIREIVSALLKRS